MKDVNKDAIVRHANRATVIVISVMMDTGETCVNMNAIRDAMKHVTRQMAM